MTWAQAFNNVGIAFAICVGIPGAIMIWGEILAACSREEERRQAKDAERADG